MIGQGVAMGVWVVWPGPKQTELATPQRPAILSGRGLMDFCNVGEQQQWDGIYIAA